MTKIFTSVLIFSVYITSLWAQTPNSGFETWVHTTGILGSYDNPTSWDSPNSQTAVAGTFECFKKTAAADIHSGSAAAQLITQNVLSLGMAPGVLTTGTLPTSTSGNITGGVAYTLRPDSIIGWYKYTPVGGDNGFFSFALLDASSDTVATGTFDTPTTTVGTYTRFSAPMIYQSSNAVVNSIWVICSSASGAPTTSNVGSTLWADDLNVIINPTTGVAEQEQPKITVAPNPVTDHVFINNISNSNAVFVLTDVTGRKITEQKITGTSCTVAMNTFPAGLYFYSIANENKGTIKTGKLIIKK